MGILDFVRNAGEKIGFGKKRREAEARAEASEAAAAERAEQAAEAGQERALAQFVLQMGFEIEGFRVDVDDGTATVRGTVADQETREKVVLAVGNTHGIGRVDDRIQVVTPAPEAKFYTVESGDTLSKIAKEFYGNAMDYPKIFEANKPMLTSPDLIYPGQVLRIPMDS